MKKFLLLLLLVGAGVFASTALATGGPPWGQDPCSHGSTGKQCKPDPQPDKGKDCEKHGKNGGVNEDHCKGTTPPPPCTVNCTPPPPCKVNCTPTPPNPPKPIEPPTVAKCPVNTVPIQANPLVCLQTETKTVVETVVKWRTKTVVKWRTKKVYVNKTKIVYRTKIKRLSCGCPSGTKMWNGKCHPIVYGNG